MHTQNQEAKRIVETACEQRAVIQADNMNDSAEPALFDLFDVHSVFIFRNLYTPTLFACLLGNALNLFFLTAPALIGSCTGRLLITKALANVAYMLLLLPHCVYIENVFFDPTSVPTSSLFFWASLKHLLYMVNVVGNVATWLTIAVTLESYIAIAYPVHASQFSTMLNVNIIIVTSCVLSAALHSTFIFNRRLMICQCDNNFPTNTTCNEAGWTPGPPPGANTTEFYRFELKNFLYFKIYHWLSSTLGLLLPIFILMCLCVALKVSLARHRTFSSSSEQKNCVKRLTTATAICHLVLESPQAFVFVMTAIVENAAQHPVVRNVIPVANYLTMLNSSISFFIYYACSERFRHICIRQLCGRCLPPEPEETQPTQARRPSRRPSQRSTQPARRATASGSHGERFKKSLQLTDLRSSFNGGGKDRSRANSFRESSTTRQTTALTNGDVSSKLLPPLDHDESEQLLDQEIVL